MKLASLKVSRPGGTLLVVSADLTLCQTVGGIAPSLEQALIDWSRVEPQLEEVYAALSAGHARHAIPFDPHACLQLAGTAGWEGRSPDGTVRLVAVPGARFASTGEGR